MSTGKFVCVENHDGAVVLDSGKRGVFPRRVRSGLGGVPFILRDLVVRHGGGLMTLMCPSCRDLSDLKLGAPRGLGAMVSRGLGGLGGLMKGCRRIDGVRLCPARFRGAPGGDVGQFLCGDVARRWVYYGAYCWSTG